MKKFLCALLSVMLAAACLVFAACGDKTGEEISLTVTEGTLYSHGKQTVELTFSSAESGAYTFEEDIDAADVTVSGGLAGKTVTEVARADDSTLRVTLSGTVTGEVGNEGVLTAGKYYLAEDVTLTTDLTISGEVTLCLNGHELRGAEGVLNM